MRLTEYNVEEALGVGPDSKPNADTCVFFTGVSTDTRTLMHGDLFVALNSETVDGHDYIARAIELGAAGVVVSQDVGSIPALVFKVEDTLIAYGQLARWWRDQFDIPVIAVTGSVGKTTTKEMLVRALSSLGPILKTELSQNNESGVPKALLRLTPEHKVAIIEMGMRGVGQIAYLCGVARPTLGLISLIAENHIELLGSRDAIADAKGELIEALPPEGISFLNANDPYFPRLAAKAKGVVVSFAVEGVPIVKAARREGDGVRGSHPAIGVDEATNPVYVATDLRLLDGAWHFQLIGQPITLGSPSRHDVGNAAAAYAIAVTLGVPPDAIAAALATYEPPPMRMEIVPAPGWDGTILNDAYNAAPASVRSALETLKTFDGKRKIAFLGDMRELGAIAAEAHEELGSTIESLGGVDALYTVGEFGAMIPGATRRFADSDQAAQFATETLTLNPGDVVLVKGSRAMKMERIAEALAAKAVAKGNEPDVA